MLKNIMILLVGASCMVACKQFSKEPLEAKQLLQKQIPSQTHLSSKDSIEFLLEKLDLDTLGMINKMVYATPDNFTHQQIYPCASCYLLPEVADALKKANQMAQKQNLRLVIYDCYRPIALQKKMYDLVNNPKYVADPNKGSKHNKACAVDLSLANSKGELLIMGTEFDDFTEEAHFANTAFNSEARKNRTLLRTIMQASGFTPYDYEWWHFNYPINTAKNLNVEWKCP